MAAPPAMTAPPGRPGLILRLVASVILTPWVIARVRHPDIEQVLVSMAVQVGRPEIATSIMNRQAMRARNAGRR